MCLWNEFGKIYLSIQWFLNLLVTIISDYCSVKGSLVSTSTCFLTPSIDAFPDSEIEESHLP